MILAALMLAAPLQALPSTCANLSGRRANVVPPRRQRMAPGAVVPLDWGSAAPGTTYFNSYFDPRCVVDLRTSTPKATFAPDLRSIRLAADIPRGSTVTISGTFEGQAITAEIKVMEEGEAPLDGIWTERARTDDCRASRIAELTFGPYGFTFTFPEMMVETMTSGSGGYRWWPVRHVLTLNGTDYPATLSDDGTLEIDGPAFSAYATPPGGKPCRLTLARTKRQPTGG